MICKNCNAQIDDGSKFCSNCGAVTEDASAITAAQEKETNSSEGNDILVLCLGILSIVLAFPFGLLGIFAVIFGSKAKKKGSDSIMNKIGIVCGWIGIAFFAIAVIGFIVSTLLSVLATILSFILSLVGTVLAAVAGAIPFVPMIIELIELLLNSGILESAVESGAMESVILMI